MEIFGGDESKVKALDEFVARETGFSGVVLSAAESGVLETIVPSSMASDEFLWTALKSCREIWRKYVKNSALFSKIPTTRCLCPQFLKI